MCPIATATYKANFPNAVVLTSRLEDLDVKSVKRAVGEIDFLFASPECTNHSCAKGAAPRDEASRATAMHVISYAKTFMPRWLVLENVVHMRPWSRYGELKESLSALGYQLEEQVLDASNYGVPQSRRRLFLVGDLEQKPTVALRKTPGPRKAARSVLDRAGTWKTSLLFDKSRAAATLERAQRGLDELGEDASFLVVYYGTDGGGGWQPLERPLRTITTVDRFALVEPGDKGPSIRMLQVPELKRAMGFSDEYLFPTGTRRDRVRLLGNGVCPPVMERLVHALVS
jgi:DNA (cytosine-5)-methyltransferase 1